MHVLDSVELPGLEAGCVAFLNVTSPEVKVSNAMNGAYRDTVCFRGSYAFAAESCQCYMVSSRPELLSKERLKTNL